MAADMELRAKFFGAMDDMNNAMSALYAKVGLLEALLNMRIAVDVVLSDFITGNYSSFKGVQLRADANGQPGYFVSRTAGPAHDGVQYIVDLVGTTFERRSLV